MSNVSKIFGVVGSAILIIFNVWAILDSLSLSGIYFFNSIINNAVPCGIVLGTLALSIIFKKLPIKPLIILNIVVFAIIAFFRLSAIVLYIIERITQSYLPPMSTLEYLEIAEFSSHFILFISVIFLIVFLLNGKIKKLTHIFGGISLLSLVVICLIYLYFFVSSLIAVDSDVFTIFVEVFKAGLIWDLLLVLGYAFIFAVLTDVMEKKE